MDRCKPVQPHFFKAVTALACMVVEKSLAKNLKGADQRTVCGTDVNQPLFQSGGIIISI